MEADFNATVCCGCLKVVGCHSAWLGGDGLRVADGLPCPHCGGEVLVSLRGQRELGADLSGQIKVRDCRDCGGVLKVVDADSGAVLLGGDGRGGVCPKCQRKRYLEKHPDPSGPEKRYRLDERRLIWALNKVKVRCPVCEKDRWLGPGLAWKKVCEKCYRKETKQA
jgi:hypothetical protein